MAVNPKDYRNDRLSQEKRIIICKEILAKILGKREKALDKQVIKLAHRAYEVGMPEGFHLTCTSDKESWFKQVRRIEVKDSNGTDLIDYVFPVNKCIPHYMLRGSSNYLRVYKDDLDKNTWQAVLKYHKSQMAFAKEKQELKSEIQVILNSIQTVRRLIEAWPEITAHYNFPKNDSVAAGVPMVLPTKVNELIKQARKG